MWPEDDLSDCNSDPNVQFGSESSAPESTEGHIVKASNMSFGIDCMEGKNSWSRYRNLQY